VGGRKNRYRRFVKGKLRREEGPGRIVSGLSTIMGGGDLSRKVFDEGIKTGKGGTEGFRIKTLSGIGLLLIPSAPSLGTRIQCRYSIMGNSEHYQRR